MSKYKVVSVLALSILSFFVFPLIPTWAMAVLGFTAMSLVVIGAFWSGMRVSERLIRTGAGIAHESAKNHVRIKEGGPRLSDSSAQAWVLPPQAAGGGASFTIEGIDNRFPPLPSPEDEDPAN